jgi:hypothetical protein
MKDCGISSGVEVSGSINRELSPGMLRYKL